MAELNPKDFKQIVVRGTNWVGDAVMTVPALRELRRLLPDARITLATRSWARGLFDGADFVDKLLVHEGSGLRSVVHQVRQWQKHGFDLALLFPNSLESALVASLARVPVRIGYAKDGRQRLLSHPVSLPDWRGSQHEVFYYLNIIAELERLVSDEQAIPASQPDGSLLVKETRQAEALRLLQQKGVRGGRPLVALCPGSVNSRAKRWPTERYAALADGFIQNLGAEVILIGSAAESELSREVGRQMQNDPVILTGQTSLEQLIAVLSIVDILVTNDTGPAHIASALGRPTLVIFGPTNPLTTAPFAAVGEIVREPPDCAPCMLRDCPIDHRCMTAISPEQVLARATSMLAKRTYSLALQNLGNGGAPRHSLVLK